MIKIEIESHTGDVRVSMVGTTSHLLADLNLATARALLMILEDEPIGLRNELLKVFFEKTLYCISKMETMEDDDDESDCD